MSLREVEGGLPGGRNWLAEIAVGEVYRGRVGATAFVITDGGAIGASCTFAGALKAALVSRRPLTLVSEKPIRVAGVRAYPVNICSSGPFLSRD